VAGHALCCSLLLCLRLAVRSAAAILVPYLGFWLRQRTGSCEPAVAILESVHID
jgi:hypothetical protein